MKSNILLRDFVYKTLIKRIAATAIGIALLLVAITYFIERQSNNELIQQLAQDGTNRVNQHIIQHLNNNNYNTLQKTLDNIPRSQVKHPDGHFVYYEIYNDKIFWAINS